jgi:PAS domain S-box-containing protein
MKSLGMRFLLPFGLLAVVFSVFVLYQTYDASRKHANELVNQQADLALEFDLAIRNYAGQKIRPNLEKLMGRDGFNPETMSTSYISRHIFEEVRKKFPDYIIRFSSENPRNPSNLANAEELKMINYFRKNPQFKRRTDKVEINGQLYLVHFTPRFLKGECMRCHGDPKDAPAELVKRYGSKGSFYRKVGDVAGLDMVAVPIEKVNAALASEMRHQTLILATGLALLFGLIIVVFKLLVTRRLAAISGHFQDIASHTESPWMRPVKVTGSDEISLLGSAFNKLLEQLRASHASLEKRVEQRTAELEQTNAELRKEAVIRRRAEDDLRKYSEEISDLYNNAPCGYHSLDPDGTFLQMNDTELRWLGYTREEVIGKMKWSDLLTPEYMDVFHKTFPVFKERGWMDNLEFELIRKDRTRLPVLLNATAIKDDKGRYIMSRSTLFDITERRQAEEERKVLQERLQRAEKMEALGTLAGGVAHDLNNVLGVVVGYAEMLLMDVDKSSSIRPRLVNIMNGGQRAAAIVQDLLTLARRGVSGREVLNLNKIIADCQQSPEFEKLSSYHSAIRIKTDLEPDLLNISGSSVHLGKTLFNLVSNASEAMPKGGILTIKTANQYLDKPIQGYDEVREGDYVVLSVSDTGEGIPVADLKRIFEPFYTKKVMGRSGTGLGLAVVWGTVKDHNGYVNVQSKEGKGSVFTLYFPVTREDISAERIAIAISEYIGKGESILVVDDVKEQRDLAAEMLQKLNYTITSVSSGEEAVAYLKEHQADLIVLDMIMDPSMDGLDTYRRVLEIHPKQKAIIVSGFSETDRVIAAQALGAGAYIRKPYVIEKLGLAVMNELARK